MSTVSYADVQTGGNLIHILTRSAGQPGKSRRDGCRQARVIACRLFLA